jgi:Anti-sigma-K factor rskA
MNDEELYADYLEHGPDAASGDRALDPATREELDTLRNLLSSNEMWAEPPADLADAVIAEVLHAREDEGASPRARPIPSAPSTSPAPSEVAKPLRRHRMRYVVAVAAAVLVLAGAAGVLATRDTDHGKEFALAATSLAPGARGSVHVTEQGSGLSLSLSVDRLPPAAPGTFYEAWMKGPKGLVPVGTFHARKGDGPIELWSGVDPADFPTMTVTIQREGAGPQSSGRVVLRGDIHGAS